MTNLLAVRTWPEPSFCYKPVNILWLGEPLNADYSARMIKSAPLVSVYLIVDQVQFDPVTAPGPSPTLCTDLHIRLCLAIVLAYLNHTTRTRSSQIKINLTISRLYDMLSLANESARPWMMRSVRHRSNRKVS